MAFSKQISPDQADGYIIRVNDLSKHFTVGERNVEVLKQITFDVQYSEFLAIVGPSGNGKTTLLNMITGIDRPTSGEVLVTGQPLHTMTENDLAIWRRSHVGIVFQFFQMLPALSLLHNVILPMDLAHQYSNKERRERAMHLLEIVGLADQADKLPGMVSGGQQQRAAIARALANDPPLLVADEPTGNLDVRTADGIFKLFCKLADQGKTLLVVTHNRALAAGTTRIIELANGKIVQNGQSKAFYRKMDNGSPLA